MLEEADKSFQEKEEEEEEDLKELVGSLVVRGVQASPTAAGKSPPEAPD